MKFLFLFLVLVASSLAEMAKGTKEKILVSQDHFAHEVASGMFALGESYGTQVPFIKAVVQPVAINPSAEGYFVIFVKQENESPTPCSPCIVSEKSACLPLNGKFNETTVYLEVEETGRYALAIKRCERGTESGNFSVDYEFRNPYGLLRGEEFYFYPYYACLSLVYVVFGLLWARQACAHWSEIIPLQQWLAIVLVIGALESVTWFFTYAVENASGNPVLGAYVTAMIFSTLKRTVSYQLILSVCLGWGIVHKNLKPFTSFKLYVLGVVYLVVYCVFAIMEELPVNISVFVVPVALLDSIYFYWMFIGINRTKAFLSLKQQHSEKLHVYTQFFHVMVIVGLLSFVVLIASVFTGPQSWEAEWLLLFPNTAFWDGVFTLLCVTIALYWSPAPGTARYLPSDDDESVPLEKRVLDAPVTAFVINDDDLDNIQSKMH